MSDIVGFVSPDYCEDSPNHMHTANSYIRKTNFLETVGSLGVYDYECRCEYCGDLFYVNERNVAQIFEEAYGGTPTTGGSSSGSFGGRKGFVVDLEEALHTTTVGKDNALLIPLEVCYFSFYSSLNLTISKSDEVLGYNFSVHFMISKDTSGKASSDLPNKFTVVPPKAPLTGIYSIVYDLDTVNCHVVTSSLKPSRSYIQGDNTKDLFSYVRNEYYSPFDFCIDDKGEISYIGGTVYLSCIPVNYSYDTDYGSSTRAASFTGDIGIIGDDGKLTKVEGDQIFNETTNNYYNPSTGDTTTVTDWFYDYSDRSYHLTTEEGDKITVTYGDENITIVEGDTTYNVYYIIENQSGSGGGGEGGDTHVHQWGQPTDTTPATCTVPGSETYTCSECGETKTTELPALGHRWKVKQSVQTKYDENGALLQEGYTIYVCERCGEEYKSTDGTGPPGGMNPGSGSGGDSGGSEDDGDKRDRFFNSDATSVMSLVVRGLYDWNLKKCNTDLKAGAGCHGSTCVTTFPSPSV